jgi:hypothetical protein
MQIAIGALLAWPTFGLHVEFDPELFLVLFIPPLLFADGWKTPTREFLEHGREIFGLALALVVVTVVGIGFLIYWVVPGIPLIPAFALAAVLSPTDAVALSGIVGEGRIPKKIMGILQGEALMNDASGLRELLATFRLTLNHANLPAALQESLNGLQSQTSAKLSLDCRLSSLALDAQKQVHLLQIVREAVLNAIKHAQASEIAVACVTTTGGIHTVSIRDNGIGIGDANEPPGHYGLNIMRERAMRLGGTLHFSCPPEGGTQVEVCFPSASSVEGK